MHFVVLGAINDPIVVPGAMTFPNKRSMINVNHVNYFCFIPVTLIAKHM